MKIATIKPVCALAVVLLQACSAPQGASGLVSLNYDPKKNETVYTVFPHGTVAIPGKWVKSHYNAVSQQQLFRNEDSVQMAISFAACNKYDFNRDGAKTGFTFVKAMYEWERDYQIKDLKQNVRLIEQDSVNNYIMWQMYSDRNNFKVNTYYLIAEKNCHVNNYSISITNKLTEDEKIALLKKMQLQ
jgi:hypothetical protein